MKRKGVQSSSNISDLISDHKKIKPKPTVSASTLSSPNISDISSEHKNSKVESTVTAATHNEEVPSSSNISSISSENKNTKPEPTLAAATQEDRVSSSSNNIGISSENKNTKPEPTPAAANCNRRVSSSSNIIGISSENKNTKPEPTLAAATQEDRVSSSSNIIGISSENNNTKPEPTLAAATQEDRVSSSSNIIGISSENKNTKPEPTPAAANCNRRVSSSSNIMGNIMGIISENKISNPEPTIKIPSRSLPNFWRRSLYTGRWSTVLGREDDMERIIQMILSDDCRGRHVSFLRVVGASGQGKTTLASNAYNQIRVREYFDAKGWVFLSADRCQQMGLVLRAIIECFTSESCGGLTDLYQLREILGDELVGKRFLLVLDDAFNEDPNFWSDLLSMLSAGAKGSVVLVTTQTERVANFEGLQNSYQLNPLGDVICWSIILQHVFRPEYFGSYLHLVTIGEKIVAKCKGVPLLSKAVAGILHHEELNEQRWNAVLQSDFWDVNRQELNMLPALRMGYNHLPARLKQCFVYCSLFPRGYLFEKDYIIQLWISQGFIYAEQGKWLEDTANEYFLELVYMSFFQLLPHDAEEVKFMVHELLFDLARSVSGDAFFRAEDYKLSYGISKDVHHLSFAPTSYDPVIQFEPFQELTGLNSLLVINSSPLRSVDSLFFVDNEASLDNIFSKSIFLRTLDLSYTTIKELPDSIEYLESLRYLGLNSTNIRKLPDSICKLTNLQRLELRNCCCLYELPNGIENLVNLQHLDVWKESGVIRTPLGIGHLTNLQTLGTFNVGGLCKISELKNLNRLEGHLRIGCLENVVRGIDVLSAFLTNKRNLKELTLQWNGRVEEIEGNETVATAEEVLENLRPNRNLRELIIRNYCGLKFPTWLADYYFNVLSSITLVNCNGCDALRKLGQLQSLRYLFMQNINGLRHVVSDLGATRGNRFPSLKSLKLWEMYDLEDWYDAKQTDFPCLQSLSISRCPRLRSLPSFSSLVELSVHCCGEFPLPALGSIRSLKIEGLQNLESLALPSTLGVLETLEIQFCNKISSVDGLDHLYSLKKLKLRNCPELHFHPEVQLPQALQVIDIHSSCSSLKDWCPNGFENISGAHNQVSRKLARHNLRGKKQVQAITEE